MTTDRSFESPETLKCLLLPVTEAGEETSNKEIRGRNVEGQCMHAPEINSLMS